MKKLILCLALISTGVLAQPANTKVGNQEYSCDDSVSPDIKEFVTDCLKYKKYDPEYTGKDSEYVQECFNYAIQVKCKKVEK